MKTLICACGGDKWERCGIQEMWKRNSSGDLVKSGRKVPLVTCKKCHTTISAELEFYQSLPERQKIGDNGCFRNV